MSMEVRDQFDTEWVDFCVASSFELIIYNSVFKNGVILRFILSSYCIKGKGNNVIDSDIKKK